MHKVLWVSCESYVRKIAVVSYIKCRLSTVCVHHEGLCGIGGVAPLIPESTALPRLRWKRDWVDPRAGEGVLEKGAPRRRKYG